MPNTSLDSCKGVAYTQTAHEGGVMHTFIYVRINARVMRGSADGVAPAQKAAEQTLSASKRVQGHHSCCEYGFRSAVQLPRLAMKGQGRGYSTAETEVLHMGRWATLHQVCNERSPTPLGVKQNDVCITACCDAAFAWVHVEQLRRHAAGGTHKGRGGHGTCRR